MDLDYIVSKYGIDTLKSQIPFDYIEVFQEELLNLKKETKFSVQYYSILTLGIETDIDEKLLNILSDKYFVIFLQITPYIYCYRIFFINFVTINFVILCIPKIKIIITFR